MKSTRIARLDSELKKLIYEIIKTEITSQEITEMFSISEVDCAPDLKTCKVYVSIYSTNENKKTATFDGIKKSAGFIRKRLGVKMHIRYVPELNFILDGAQEYGNKIDLILSTLNIKKEEENDDN